MRLARDIRARAGSESSPFRAQLLREDAARLDRLEALAASAADFAAFREGGRRLGWTQGDARTGELAPALDPFLEAFYAAARGASPPPDAELEARWAALYNARIERLIGCLSTPPRPE